MIFLAKDKNELEKLIDEDYYAEKSIVLRYRNAFRFEGSDEEDSAYKDWLRKTSLREGTRIFRLLRYKGVDVHIFDETSLMHTRTLKSIDGCITIARCRFYGHHRVFFESGGNTGTALTEYGHRAGLETFLFIPEDNLPLLNSRTFRSRKAHLITVKEPGMVKKVSGFLENLDGLQRIPRVSWRYEASMFRGMFILEHMLSNQRFDWISQTISAAFGPIGIYRVMNSFKNEIGGIPKFLGIQQEGNCPMYKAWRTKKDFEPVEVKSTRQLLTKVMYDDKPYTYGTYMYLKEILSHSAGDLATINRSEFMDLLGHNFDQKNVLDLLRDKGIEITVSGGEVVEKTGLIALAGTLKAIDNNIILKGSRVLCCLTSGISKADGKAKSEFSISNMDDASKAVEKIRSRT